ncbi:MAG: EthD family reductase [Pseudonocardiaceae bacterium]|nr:MAG: EthD family reductase [Pseudonocardiaceae bacterium]
MHRLTILYGHPDDPAAFDEHFWSVHVPLAQRIEGFTGWTVGLVEPADPADPAPYHQAVALYAPTRDDIDAALATPEGKAAVDDVANFATGGVTMFYDEQRVLIPLQLSGTEQGA